MEKMRHFGKVVMGLVLALVFGLAGGYFYRMVLPYRIGGIDAVDPTVMTGEFDETARFGEFEGRRVAPLSGVASSGSSILGLNNLPKRIEVDLTNQRVYAYEGDQKVFDFIVSTGKWAPTPTGTFRIWGKSRYQKMSGGNKALHTYYYLPNVPFIMWFSNGEIAPSRGFSLHGTYWHNNFGQPMSHGCVNMKIADAEKLFYWSNPSLGEKKYIKATEDDPGTEIVIYGETPKV